ncbi:hypothetical protein BN2476_1550011 [Paraburkholderia piptadeniae]|uniref:Uncharacterized protein n=1 Tax=Paraburkholderia piptadeniae TaxID=1701573 RepID=A0A1N7SX71_9BURK|nr:hypothetical protein BN2476_1550011 [Paraburkholderia piptadeniae]
MVLHQGEATQVIIEKAGMFEKVVCLAAEYADRALLAGAPLTLIVSIGAQVARERAFELPRSILLPAKSPAVERRG